MSKPLTPVLVCVDDFEPDRPGRVEGCCHSDARRRLPKCVVFTFETHDFDDAKHVARTPHET